MNTRKLRDIFDSDYKEFFESNTVVYSMPWVIKLVWDLDKDYSWLCIYQKLPLRNLMWSYKTNKKRIELGDFWFYKGNTSAIQKYKLKEFFPQHTVFESDLNDYIKKHWYTTQWIKVHTFFEAPSGTWCGQTESFFFLLATHIIYNSVYKETNKVDFSKVSSVATDLMNLYFEKCNNGDFLMPHTPKDINRVSFTKGHLPFIANKRTNEIFYAHDQSMQFDNTHQPIDMMLIDTNVPMWREKKKIEWYAKRSSRYNEAEKLVRKNITTPKQQNLNKRIKNLQKLHESLSVLAAANIIEASTPNRSETNFEEIVSLLNEIYYTTTSHIKLEWRIRQWMKKIRSCVSNISDEIALFNWENGMMWWFLWIASQAHTFRSKLSQLDKQLWENYSFYTSREDWYEYGEFTIEQNLYASVKSSKSWKKMLVQTTDKEYLIEPHMVEDEIAKYDIRADTLEGKIYVQWKKLSSKNILSQTFTCEVLHKVINTPDLCITNKDLSRSGYARSKNELTGKIIYPFVKCINELIDQELRLGCAWSTTNYSISLQKWTVSIWVLVEI